MEAIVEEVDLDVALQGQRLETLEKQVEKLAASVDDIQKDVRALLELWTKALGFIGVVKWLLTAAAAILAIIGTVKSWGK